jgi:uncharacterized protein YndB with AHSA1/START domain
VTEIDARMGAPENVAKREVVITRIFDAPRGLVFKAWTDPEHMARWWAKGLHKPYLRFGRAGRRRLAYRHALPRWH